MVLFGGDRRLSELVFWGKPSLSHGIWTVYSCRLSAVGASRLSIFRVKIVFVGHEDRSVLNFRLRFERKNVANFVGETEERKH